MTDVERPEAFHGPVDEADSRDPGDDERRHAAVNE